MPAQAHTRKANTSRRKRMWQHVKDSVESRGGTRGSAMRQANGVVLKDVKKKKRRKKGKSKGKVERQPSGQVVGTRYS